MTAPRQRGKPHPVSLCVAIAAAVALFGAPAAVCAQTPKPLVVNPHTGLAISGFDPVAYFTDNTPRVGRADLEFSFDGSVWRFVNEGDRAAFVEHPDIYAPRFGGYDPVAIGRGVSVPGHPLFWVVAGERLYLFYDEAAREEFLADPGGVIERATLKWPSVASAIAR